MLRHNPCNPACIIAVITALLVGLLFICQIYSLKDAHPVPKLLVGSDYLCFYAGTKNLLLKGSPYHKGWYSSTIDDYAKPLARYAYNPTIPWYCFPPVAASLNYPLSLLGLETAAKLMFFLLLAAVVIANGLVTKAFDYPHRNGRTIVFLCSLMIILLSYPVYFLIVRGHLIGITFLLIAAGIYLFKKDNPFCGVCFGIATSMFLFPGLIILPLLLFRRYKTIVYMGATLLMLFLCCPDLWWLFVKDILALRVATKDILNQNCSLAAVFLNSAMVLEKAAGFAGFQIKFTRLYNETSLVVYGLLLSIMALSDYTVRKKNNVLDRNIETALVLMYAPFMIAIPKVTFPYCLVILILLIPAVCALMHRLKEAMSAAVFWLLTGGIALSQFQAQAFETLLNPRFFSLHFLSAFGLLLVMIGCVAFKVRLCRALPFTGEAEGKALQ